MSWFSECDYGSSSEWRRLRSTAILLIACSSCIYLPTLLHGLFADDEIYLAYSNQLLRNSAWSELYLLLLKPANPWEYLPLRDFTYWLDFRLYGDEPSGFHLTNYFWYGLSVFGAGWLCREILGMQHPVHVRRSHILALCGAVIFIVHPVHVEAMAWVAGRKDLIAGTFGLMASAFLLRGIRHEWRSRDLLLSALLLLAACFGKGTATALIIFLSVLIGACWRLSPEVPALRKTAFLLLFWIIVLFASFVHMKVGDTSGIRIVNDPGLFAMIERASRILTELNGLLFLPLDLGLYHDVYALGDWHWLTTSIILILLGIALHAIFQSHAVWGFGVVLAETPLFVYLQFFPFTTWSLASERFLFVSVAGVALVLVDIFNRIERPRRIVAVLLAIVMPCAILGWNRVADWEYGSTLFVREYERQPLFHNAIRDRIMFDLLAKKNFVEARELARQLDHDYAKDTLLALIETEQAYQRLRQASETSGANMTEVTKAQTFADEKKEFCEAVALLQRSLDFGYRQIPGEVDISYNNLLRSQERRLSDTYAGSKRICSE